MSDPAFPSPYTDPNITVRNPPHTSTTPTPAYHTAPSQVSTYDVADRQVSGFSHTDPPAANPVYSIPGRNPYANDGMVGQNVFKNSLE